MKRLSILLLLIPVTLFSCKKEYIIEGGNADISTVFRTNLPAWNQISERVYTMNLDVPEITSKVIAEGSVMVYFRLGETNNWFQMPITFGTASVANKYWFLTFDNNPDRLQLAYSNRGSSTAAPYTFSELKL